MFQPIVRAWIQYSRTAPPAAGAGAGNWLWLVRARGGGLMRAASASALAAAPGLERSTCSPPIVQNNAVAAPSWKNDRREVGSGRRERVELVRRPHNLPPCLV